MALRVKTKFNFNRIKSRVEQDANLIPSPRVVTVDEAVAPFNLDRNVQIHLGQWAAEQERARMTTKWFIGADTMTSNGSGGIWFDSDSKTYKPEFPVHPKMKGKDRPYAAELQPHWERATRLGLEAQATAIGNMALKKDIEELTRCEDYLEVTDRDLEAMFEFPRLRRKVRWYNLKAKAKRLFMGKGEGKIILRLKKDSPERCGVAIPFGAQLRLEEAKEKGIFDSYQVIYPNIVTESQLAAERARERDPALVGLCAGVMYLICSWDLPEDIKKAETDMEALKALKIEG